MNLYFIEFFLIFLNSLDLLVIWYVSSFDWRFSFGILIKVYKERFVRLYSFYKFVYKERFFLVWFVCVWGRVVCYGVLEGWLGVVLMVKCLFRKLLLVFFK